MSSLPDIVRVMPARDAACPVCRYSMLDAPSAVCPECGEVLEVWVRHAPESRPGISLWSSGFIACAIALGTLVVGIEPLTDILPLRRAEVWRVAVLLSSTVLFASVGAVLFETRRRRLTRARERWNPGHEWLAAVDAVVRGEPIRCGRKSCGHDHGECAGCHRPLQLALRPVEPIHLFDRRRPELATAIIFLASSLFNMVLKVPIAIFMLSIYFDLMRSSPVPPPPEAKIAGLQIWGFSAITLFGLTMCASGLFLIYFQRRRVVRWPRQRRILLAVVTGLAAVSPWTLLWLWTKSVTQG